MAITKKEVWKALETVVDPEIPAVTLIELGIIRRVDMDQDRILVAISPTFSGCPALHVMQEDVRRALSGLTDLPVHVEVQLSPPWTSDFISPAGREKLISFGLATPPIHGGDIAGAIQAPVECPYCASENTTRKNSWGPTPCRMIYYCNACQQPFELFKPL